MPKILKIILFHLILIWPVINALHAQVINYETVIRIEDGEKITEKSYLIQVNNKESNWLSHIEIHHSPNEEFDLIEAQIIGPTGDIKRELRKKEIVTKSDLSYGTFYQDDLIEEFNLYWTEYPYQIKYAYRITDEEFVYVTKWYPIVYTGVATLNSSLHIELPIDYKISVSSAEGIEFEEIIADDRIMLHWRYGLLKAPKSEIYCAPLMENLPNVSIVPIDFKYGIAGSQESWSSFGTWNAELNRGADELTVSEKFAIDRLVEGIDNKQEIINLLYQYLQDKTKYVNVAIDVGGLKSYPASYVCKNKYGDCKALTTYMKAMLKYVGIESYYTLVNAGDNAVRINKYLPSQQFNHVILSIPLEGDSIWLENTANYLPYNYLGTFTQDRFALMVKDEGGQLIRTPKLEIADVLEKSTYQFVLDENGEWRVRISRTLKGDAFESYRAYQSRTNQNDQKEKIVKDIAIGNFELLEWEIEEGNRDDRQIKTTAFGKCASQIRVIGKIKVINPLRIKIPEFEEPKKRILSVRINYPINKSDSIIYHLPLLQDHEFQLPENIDLTTPYGKYKSSYALEGNTLTVSEIFILNSGDYPIEEYAQFYEFISAIIKCQKRSAIILK